jgi:prevent-host-death family protein
MPPDIANMTMVSDHGHIKGFAMSKTVKASEFKAKCLQLMDEVAASGETVIITKHGKPVAKLSQVVAQPPKSIFGALKGMGRITGDIVSPLDVEWEAMKE